MGPFEVARLPRLRVEHDMMIQPVDGMTLVDAAYDPPLDPGITAEVEALRAGAVETFESCQGGRGHAYAEPTVRFHGDQAEGFRALAVAMRAKLRVTNLRRVWPVLDGEPTGPWWELVFAPTTVPSALTSAD